MVASLPGVSGSTSKGKPGGDILVKALVVPRGLFPSVDTLLSISDPRTMVFLLCVDRDTL